MTLLLEYVQSLVPAGGSEICAAWGTVQRVGKDPAGHSFHDFALHQAGLKAEPEEEEQDDSSKLNSNASRSSLLDDQIPEGVSWKGSKKKKKKDGGPKLDYYKLLGLQNERWMADENQIKNAYRRAALEHHPDKAGAAVADEEEKARIEAHFLQVQEAYEHLSDPAKRREYDSIDEFDDSLPESCASADFYRVFGPAFRRQSRWSQPQPVPELGEDDAPEREVDRFYKFWFGFKSWREFPHPDEEDVEQAEGRDHKRWIERFNAKLREKAKKEETKRLKAFVESAFNQDPRMVRRREAERAEKEARKQAKNEAKRQQQEAAEATAKAEAEAKAKAEADAAVAAAEAKRARLTERKAMQKERSRLRGICSSADGGPLIGDFELGQLCEKLSLAQLQDLRTGLEADGSSRQQRIDLIQNNQRQMGLQAAVEAAAKEQAAAQAAAEAAAALRQEAADRAKRIATWTDDEKRLLEKALAKFPVGTAKRWEAISAYVRTRTVDEVIDMAKHGLKAGAGIRATTYVPTGKRSNTEIKSEATARHESFTDVDVNLQVNGTPKAANGKASPAANGAKTAAKSPASDEWSEEQQLALVAAMKIHGKELPDRWERIARTVNGKTKAQCFKRFKELRENFRAKKQGS